MRRIIVLSGRNDPTARALAARWDAALMTPLDLSTPGWRYHAPGSESGFIVAEGRVIQNSQVRGVVTRLPYLDGSELEHVEAEDCAYVASEMGAFLLAWLSSLRCPVINRPTPDCLCGPGWRPEQWVRLAFRLGVPVQPIHRDSSLGFSMDDRAATSTVTVVGDRCFGSPDATVAAQSKQLAAAAGVELLELRYTESAGEHRFLGVNLCPDLSGNNVADALLDHLETLAAC